MSRILQHDYGPYTVVSLLWKSIFYVEMYIGTFPSSLLEATGLLLAISSLNLVNSDFLGPEL